VDHFVDLCYRGLECEVRTLFLEQDWIFKPDLRHHWNIQQIEGKKDEPVQREIPGRGCDGKNQVSVKYS
jgi:hypothetical protein